MTGSLMNEREIFSQALQKSDPEERSAFLDEVCGRETPARQHIERLLSEVPNLGDYLEQPAMDSAGTELVSAGKDNSLLSGSDTVADMETRTLEFLSPSDNPDALGQLGKYEILEVIGRGGMGIVLRSFDPKLSRVVAIKVLSPEFAANPTAHKRFLREAKTAAAVSHDHIVTIYAVEENPIPHLVMEFIDGKSLQQRIDEEGQLEVKEGLRIARQIAVGLAAAHEQGLTHRDIKPSNILLQNGIQRVQITDFGLARATSDLDITRTGEIAGTPQYMSPEQAKSEAVDPRSDLFSLGSVMYAMCSGRSPFRADTPYGSIKRVCEDEPRSLRENNPEIPVWLEAIVFKLLEKNADDRFQTAREVADLLAKHLSHLQDPGSTPFPGTLLAARPPRRKLVHPRILAAAAVMLLTVAALGFTEAAGVTHVTSTVIRLATGEGTLIIELADPSVHLTLDGEDLSISGEGFQELKLSPGQYQFRATKNGAPVKTELVSIERGGRRVVRVGLESSKTTPQAKTNTAEYRSIPDGAVSEIGRFARLGNSWVGAIQFSADGQHLVCEGVRPEVWDLESGSVVRLPQSESGACTSLAVSPDAKYLATGYIEHGAIALWDLGTQTKVREFIGHVPQIRALAFSPDGHFLLSVSTGDLTARLWDVQTAEQIWQFDCDKFPVAAAFSPQGDTALVGDANLLHMIDVNSGEEVWQTNKAATAVFCADFSPNGRYLVSGSGDGTLQLWNAETGEEIRQFDGHRAYVRSVRFLPDGRHLISGSEDKTLRIWNVETRSEVARVEADGHFVQYAAVSPDGRSVATAGGHFRTESGDYERDGDYDVRLWQLPESVWPQDTTTEHEDRNQITEVRRFAEFDEIWSVAITPDSRYVLCTGQTEVTNPLVKAAARVWDRRTGRLIHTWRPTAIRMVAVSPDSRTAALGAYDGRVFLYDIESGRECGVLEGHSDLVRSIDFSGNGEFLVSGSEDGTARLWNLAERREAQAFHVETGVLCARISADGGRVLTSSYRAGVNFWDATSGDKLRQLIGPRTSINRVDLSGDGRFVGFQYHHTAPEHKLEIGVVDTESGDVVQRLRGHLADINELLFLPDGRRILSGDLGKTLRLWDWRSGQELSKIELPNHIPLWLAVSGDGRYAVSGGSASVYEELQSATDRTVRLWRLPESVSTENRTTAESTSRQAGQAVPDAEN